MIKCLAIMCFWFGTVDVIEDDTLTVELSNSKDEIVNMTWAASEFPCELKEGTQFVLTKTKRGNDSRVWCASR